MSIESLEQSGLRLRALTTGETQAPTPEPERSSMAEALARFMPSPPPPDRVEIGPPSQAAREAAHARTFDRTAPPVQGAQYFNAAIGKLVQVPAAGDPSNTSSVSNAPATPSGPSTGEWKISPMGNLYQPLGAKAVEEARKDPHNLAMMEGYEANIEKLSRTHDLAQWDLGERVKELGQKARGANWNGPTPEGAAAQTQIDALVASWDPVAGTYQGFDENAARERFARQDQAAGLTLNGKIARRRKVGLGEEGFLRPGFSKLLLPPSPFEGMTQDQARRKVWLDFHPLSTEAQYLQAIHDPSRDQGPNYLGFEINAIASANWGMGRWGESNALSAKPRPAGLGPERAFDYFTGFK